MMHPLPSQYRPYFPVVDEYVYLDHATMSPIARQTGDKMVQLLEGVMNGGSAMSDELTRTHTEARHSVARLVNAKPHEIGFLRNASEAISVMADGISWHPEDNVVTVESDCPITYYWLRAMAGRGVEIRTAPDSADIHHIRQLVDERTRLLALSWVQFATGKRASIRALGELCRELHIIMVLDVTHGLGALQLDVERDYVDVFAASAHTFLLGPPGLALLYVSDRVLGTVRPSVIGWTAVENYDDYRWHPFNFRQGAIRFEGGTLNEVGICGLAEGVKLLLDAGPNAIEQYLLSLNDYLVDRLNSRGYEVLSPPSPGEKSSIIVFRHRRWPGSYLHARLRLQNVITSSRFGRLRVSPHFYNTRDDVDRLLDLLPG